MLYNFLIALIVLASLLVTGLVLIQNSKGGGLASGFASGNQVMGAPKTADFLEKATWGLIATIALLSIFAVGAHKNMTNTKAGDSQIIEQAIEMNEEAQQSAAVPAFEDEAGEE